MRKLPPFVASGLCLLLIGCQTPLFSDGLFSSLTPNRTLTAQKSSLDTDRSVSATKPRIGGRGWRKATTREAEKQTQAPAIGLNNVDQLREFLAKGNDAMQKGLYDDARIQYETVLSLEPHHATAHHMLGRISDLSKRFDEAERHYLEALSANREDGYLLNDLGYSYLQQGRLDEARQYLTQAITREPDLAIAKVNLAAVYAYGGDERGALAWLRQVGSEQQAQETLAGLKSKPAPWIMNGSAEALATSQDNYSLNKNGQVLDANGNPLRTFEEVQKAMEIIRNQQARARLAKEQRGQYLEDQRIRQAMGQSSSFNPRGAASNNDANLNDQMQAIEHAAGTDPRQLNSRPIYVGPQGLNGGQEQSSSQGQYSPQNFGTTAPRPDWNTQGQIQQFPPGNQQGQFATQQDSYSNLLNPAGPTGFPQQGYPNQQMPPGQPDPRGLTVPPQFPGSPSSPNLMTVPRQFSQQFSQQFPQQGQPPNQGQPESGNPALPNWGQGQPAVPQQLPQQFSSDAVPRDQYGNPIQSFAPANPAWNGQAGIVQPAQGGSAPNSNFYGQHDNYGQHNNYSQGNNQLNAGPQTGDYANNSEQFYLQSPAGQNVPTGPSPNGNAYYPSGQPAPMNQVTNQVQSANGWNVPQQQPIQQLGFDEQRPMARIDRGQRIQQYSAADRQAMQLGMAAGFGALAPIDTLTDQTAQSGQRYGNGSPQNNTFPNAGSQNPAAVTPENSGFNYDQSGQPLQQRPFSPQGQPLQQGQFSPQGQGLPDRGYPGAVPANSGQLPGQTSIQAPNRQIHGQSIADQTGQDPQTAQAWLRMPTSQADVTMPAAFSSSTQPTQQQSANWQRPETAGSSWQHNAFTSPTTQPGFGQPHMTNPHLRSPDAQTGQSPTGQEINAVSWGNQ
ncbi:MAG: tetratricopeptide repeat protein [Planctomycetota bacterium]|nr:tetratricopeptide repeat protein [Planctomycetota bacterium]